MYNDIIIKSLNGILLWDLGSVCGPKIYHMDLIISLNNVRCECCGFLDPSSTGSENVSPFTVCSFMHACFDRLHGIHQDTDGLCTVPSSIKQHFGTCCQDLNLHTVLWLFSNSGFAVGSQMKTTCIKESRAKVELKGQAFELKLNLMEKSLTLFCFLACHWYYFSITSGNIKQCLRCFYLLN